VFVLLYSKNLGHLNALLDLHWDFLFTGRRVIDLSFNSVTCMERTTEFFSVSRVFFRQLETMSSLGLVDLTERFLFIFEAT
jgi:hypothetical protein